MNVTCPQCATIFRVDPAKVPEQGVRARCSVCSGLIAVRRPPIAAPPLPSAVEIPGPALAAPSVTAQPPRAAAVEPPRVEVPAREAAPVVAHPPAYGAGDPHSHRAAPELPVATDPPFAPAPVRSALPAPDPAIGAPAVHSPARFNNPFLQQDPSTRARRLARALVSDLVVYYPEKRQRGLAEGNLKELFGEEIRKSWEEYSEQVGQDIAANTPYFTEALNEILAEGRSLFG